MDFKDSQNLNRGDRTMRKVFSVALMAAMVCLVGLTKDAAAAITITLEWGACGGGTGGCTALGGDTITVNAGGGQTLRLDVFLQHDLSAGFESHSFSLNFDTALDNELNLGPMASVEWGGTDVNPSPSNSFPYSALSTGVTTLDSTGGNAGRINSYESAALAGVLPANNAAYSIGTNTATAPTRYRVGQAFFTVNGATSDGADIFSGAFNLPGILDSFVDGNGTFQSQGTVTYGNATVNVVPEPGTVSLLGLGLLGLILAGRRARRS
jgi:hypothetical protein